MVTSLLMLIRFSSVFEKSLICTENAIAGQIFNQFLPFQNSVLFPVMTELSAKTACRNLFRSRRSSLTETYNLKSDPILLIYIARRRRRTRILGPVALIFGAVSLRSSIFPIPCTSVPLHSTLVLCYN